MFIDLEGIDGTGKTTVAKLLACEIDAIFYSTPPKEFLDRREKMDAEATPQEHYKFYLDGVRAASKDIWGMLALGNNVVCDRYWLTTYVYHRAMGLSVSKKDFSDLVMPNLTVFLMVDPDEQARRLLERGLSAGDRRMINRQEALAREYKRCIAKLENPVCAISTDHLTPIEIVERVIVAINQL